MVISDIIVGLQHGDEGLELLLVSLLNFIQVVFYSKTT